MDNEVKKMLVNSAISARERSFCPISGFAVGAALLASDGTVYQGCNIECAGLSASNCAERTAIFKAVSEGIHSFEAIAIIGGLKDRPILDYCPPCGICRQAMAQFCKLDSFRVIVALSQDDWKEFTLGELLPMAFQRFQPED